MSAAASPDVLEVWLVADVSVAGLLMLQQLLKLVKDVDCVCETVEGFTKVKEC